jgi:hypothetical protein
MRARHLAVAGLAAVLLAACGGGDSGNGEAAKKGPQVAKDAAAALDKAGSTHIAGSVTSSGQTESIDLDLQGSDASGTVGEGGQNLKLISTGGKVYVQAPAEFWTAQGLPAAAGSQLGGKWVIVPQEAASSLNSFTLKSLTDELRNPSDSKIKDPVTTATVAGKKIVVVSQENGSTVNVAAEGTAYPLQFENKGGSDTGTLKLSEFGKKFGISAPSGALDLSQLMGG